MKEGATLSKAEVAALKGPLEAALADCAGYADEGIWKYCDDQTKMPIWSSMDDEEIEKIARFMLRRGERSPQMANTVRTIVNGSETLDLLMILAPRAVTTIDKVARKPRRAKGGPRGNTP